MSITGTRSRGRCQDCKDGNHCGSCQGCCSENGDEEYGS